MQHATERVERPGESQEALDGKKRKRSPKVATKGPAIIPPKALRHRRRHRATHLYCRVQIGGSRQLRLSSASAPFSCCISMRARKARAIGSEKRWNSLARTYVWSSPNLFPSPCKDTKCPSFVACVRSVEAKGGESKKQTTHQKTKTKLSNATPNRVTKQSTANANAEKKAFLQQCRSRISTSPTPRCQSLRQQQHSALAKMGNMQTGLETLNQQRCFAGSQAHCVSGRNQLLDTTEPLPRWKRAISWAKSTPKIHICFVMVRTWLKCVRSFFKSRRRRRNCWDGTAWQTSPPPKKRSQHGKPMTGLSRSAARAAR